jgi:hypothetical protein
MAIQCTKTFEYTVKVTAPKASASSNFEDANIVADFLLLDEAIAIQIKNKTSAAIQVNWDNVSLVDINGKSNRIIHTGIRLIDRDKPQAPSIIPPGAVLKDEITPVDNIRYESGQYGGWKTDPLMPPLGDNQHKYVGKTISVFMPLEINGKKKEYNFTLEIIGIKEREIR